MVSEQPVSVSADGLAVASRHAATWEDAARRAEHGETVAVIAHGEHIADVVPSGKLDRLRETIAVLSDSDLMSEYSWTLRWMNCAAPDAANTGRSTSSTMTRWSSP